MLVDHSPAERRLIAKKAAHTRWANTPDRLGAMAPARRGFEEKLARQVDPDGKLSPAERGKAVESARKAFYADMALKSAAARRRRKGGASAESPAGDIPPFGL